MRIKKLLLIFVIGLSFFCETNAQECPSNVLCNSFLLLIFDENPQPSIQNVTLDFGLNNPLNGTYNKMQTINAGRGVFFDVPFCEASDPFVSFTLEVTFNYTSGASTTCSYEGGHLVEEYIPSGVFADCEETLIDVINDNIDDIQCKQWDGACDDSGIITREGKVSIGTSNSATGFQVAVRGKILTEQVKVQVCNWCDYVFEKDYNLWPLEKLERYIAQENKLPGFPSAKTIDDDGGFELGEITLLQQEKIEELFLHLIELDEELSEIKNSLSEK